MRRIRTKRTGSGEAGFTLIELLVTVLIIGIIAAIAIPVFLSQRERAWNGVTQSQLRNAAVAMTSYYTDTGSYGAAGLNPGFGYIPSADVAISVESADADGYCVQANHVSRPTAVFHIADGTPPTPGNCP